MFGIVGRKSRSQLVRQELGQSVDHFKQAATHAARGTGATVGPKFDAARDRVQPAAYRAKDAASTGWDSALAALAPLAAAAGAAGDTARKTGKDARKAKNRNMKKLQKKTNKALKRKQSGRKTGTLAGLLVAGAAVGAAAAYLVKRRQRQQWDEYDPSRPIDSVEQAGTGADDAAFEPADTFATPTSYSASSPVYGEQSDPTVDQTSSKLNSPESARTTKH